MFGLIRKIIENNGSQAGKSANPEIKKHVAACVLLLEAAHADGTCTEEEMEHIVRALPSKFGLTADCVKELIELAHAERAEAMDLWQFTNRINKNCSPREKLAIMEDVWRIIHMDGQLEKHEDYFAHKLANLLHLTHKELIDAKLKAREEMRQDYT